MKVRKIYGVKGGLDPGYEPIPAFDGARAGLIWCPGAGDEIIDRDDQPIELVVEGYPEPRDFNNTESRIIKVTMTRRGSQAPLVEFHVNLFYLAQKPSIVASEWHVI